MQKANRDQQQSKPDTSFELRPAMSKEEADSEVRQLGVSQEQLDMDISALDTSDLVDPKYLPALAARLLREGKMPNFNNPQVLQGFKQIIDEASKDARKEQAKNRKNNPV